MLNKVQILRFLTLKGYRIKIKIYGKQLPYIKLKSGIKYDTRSDYL
jgi:hypothetical protein